MKRILVLGATGAMGIYLVPELARRGYAVDALSLDESGPSAGMAGVTYHQCNAKDDSVLRTFFDRRHYDAIVDFMLYSTAEVEARHRMMLDNTDHYIFLSSYRVYADEEHPVRETSPRLLDVTTDEAFLARHLKEYALYKAEQEDVLRASGARNFTILRPTMIFDGVSDKNIRKFAAMVRKLPVMPIVGGGKALLQPVHKCDLADACWRVINHPEESRNQIYTVSGHAPMPLRDMLTTLARVQGKKIRFINLHLPNVPLFL